MVRMAAHVSGAYVALLGLYLAFKGAYAFLAQVYVMTRLTERIIDRPTVNNQMIADGDGNRGNAQHGRSYV